MALFGIGSGTLYWPGCFSSALVKKSAANYTKILKRLRISISTIDSITCCTGVLINAGYDKEARKIMRENFEILKKKGIKSIITSCPLCYKTLSKDYEEMLPDYDLQAEFILVPILDRLKQSRQFIEKMPRGQILYHDSCYLGRYSEIYDQPRQILKILGYEVIELACNRTESLCSGACSNLPQVNPELADAIAKNLIKQISRTGINKIVTADPQVYFHLKQNLQGTNIEIFEFSELLKEAIL